MKMDLYFQQWYTWHERNDPTILITSKLVLLMHWWVIKSLTICENTKKREFSIIFASMLIVGFVVQIRVSSEISNAPFILNLDCDMYSNNADTIQEILCFFLDETKGQDIAYVQFPQSYNNITKNDHYGNSYLVSAKVIKYLEH